MSDAHAWIPFAAHFVMSVNYELFERWRDSRMPLQRRLGLVAKTRSLIAYDQVITRRAIAAGGQLEGEKANG
jgi:hypothetical protein